MDTITQVLEPKPLVWHLPDTVGSFDNPEQLHLRLASHCVTLPERRTLHNVPALLSLLNLTIKSIGGDKLSPLINLVVKLNKLNDARSL